MNDHPCPQCHARGKAKLHLQAPRFLRCDQCGVMYRAPFPDAASLARWYSEKRWREAARPSHIVLFTPAALQKSLLATGFRDVRRPRWFIRYPSASLLRAVAHFGMQGLGIDGGLRVVARRP
jgi:hypothetical protein